MTLGFHTNNRTTNTLNLNKIFSIILLFHGSNCKVKCQCIYEKSTADYQVVLFDEGQKVTLRKITEQGVAFKFVKQNKRFQIKL